MNCFFSFIIIMMYIQRAYKKLIALNAREKRWLWGKLKAFILFFFPACLILFSFYRQVEMKRIETNNKRILSDIISTHCGLLFNVFFTKINTHFIIHLKCVLCFFFLVYLVLWHGGWWLSSWCNWKFSFIFIFIFFL